MKDCIFCKIIKREIPSAKIYEDEKIYVFLDIAPTNKGHTLVVPKEHHETFEDTPDEIIGTVFAKARHIAKAIIKATKAQGFNVIVNNKKAAGQVVDHLHVHLIPRFDTDGFKHWPQGKYEQGEDKAIADEIKSFL